jgi:hypothetical protein
MSLKTEVGAKGRLEIAWRQAGFGGEGRGREEAEARGDGFHGILERKRASTLDAP